MVHSSHYPSALLAHSTYLVIPKQTSCFAQHCAHSVCRAGLSVDFSCSSEVTKCKCIFLSPEQRCPIIETLINTTDFYHDVTMKALITRFARIRTYATAERRVHALCCACVCVFDLLCALVVRRVLTRATRCSRYTHSLRCVITQSLRCVIRGFVISFTAPCSGKAQLVPYLGSFGCDR